MLEIQGPVEVVDEAEKEEVEERVEEEVERATDWPLAPMARRDRNVWQTDYG